MVAEATRAPVESCTVPRSEPRGFWACRTDANTTTDTKQRSNFRIKSFSLSERSCTKSGIAPESLPGGQEHSRLEMEGSVSEHSTTRDGRSGDGSIWN